MIKLVVSSVSCLLPVCDVGFNFLYQIINIKKTLKAQSQDPDEAMATDSREAVAQGGEKGKKPIKAKSLRSSSKFWQKS